MGLEILVENRWIGKMELVDNLLDAVTGVLEHVLGFDYDEIIYPLRSRASANLLDELGKILRRQPKLFCIERHTSF